MDWKTIKEKVGNEFYVARYKVTNGAKSAIDWVVKNPEAAAIILPVAYGTVKGAGKLVGRIDRNREIKKMENLKDRYVYDRSIGAYLEMNRKPTSNEYLEIESRKQNGEPLAAILRSMRLI